MAVKWKWKPAAGGSVPAGLENRVQAVETKASTNETNITNLQTNTAKLNQNNTFTGTNTFNNAVSINSAGQDFTWATTRTWAQNVDNSVVKTKDLKYVRVFEKTQATSLGDAWNTDLSWTIQGINTDGLHEFLIIVSIDNVAYSRNGKIVWKNGLGESKSQYLIISNGASECYFQLVIKGANNFRIYHKKTGSAVSLQWIRGWIVRAGDQPWKMNQLW